MVGSVDHEAGAVVVVDHRLSEVGRGATQGGVALWTAVLLSTLADGSG